MTAYYNENEPFAAQWLRNLVAADLIAPGDVDDRSIRDVQPGDVAGYTQCHFFVGIGIWSAALRKAGWPDTRPVWTGSCPCQPFSIAGNGNGFDDPRHLWPAWELLIGECRPATIFGEQVEGPAGRAWFDLVSADLERSGYAVGASVLCSAGVGAPNIRRRLYWMADAKGGGCGEHGIFGETLSCWENAGQSAQRVEAGPHDPWRELEWIACLDGKARPTQPGLFPLAARNPGDVGKLRAYGNAINAVVAQEFIAAAMAVLR